MNRFHSPLVLATCSVVVMAVSAHAASDASSTVSNDVIAEQRAMLKKTTAGSGFGPQSPRDISSVTGNNHRSFGTAPAYKEMNLCNIHFHENAEHKGGEFTTYAGNGDGEGYNTGYKYTGTLTNSELSAVGAKIGESKHGDLIPGDTIEIHFVHSSAKVSPGPTLGACISKAITNPDLRVETVVAVLVNDENAEDFEHLASIKQIDGLYQAINLPNNLGAPVNYSGSTTGPGYNEKGSPFQVTWSVRPKVVKIGIKSVGKWLEANVFDEDHAHGVRNLVINPDLLSPIN